MARSDRRGADNAELVNKKPAAKVSREVTWRCKSSGDPGDREPLAEQQLRRREAGWEGSCKQISGPRNTNCMSGRRQWARVPL